MDPLASNNNSSAPELEDMFADTDSSSTPVVHELLPEDIAIAPTITTLKASPKFWLWRFRKILIALAIIIVGAGIIVAVLYWLQTRLESEQPVSTNPADSSTNSTTVNSTVPVNATSSPVTTNQPTVTNSTVDTDHDGLSDQEELLYNTNPKKKDTDEDGLSDREEVRVYTTDPRNPDTDGDGYKDGEEVTHFYDPNSSDPKKRLFELPN